MAKMDLFVEIKDLIKKALALFDMSESYLIDPLQSNEQLSDIYDQIQGFQLERERKDLNVGDIENLGVELWNKTVKYKNKKILNLKSVDSLLIANARRISFDLIKLGRKDKIKNMFELCFKISSEYLESNELAIAEHYSNECDKIIESAEDQSVFGESYYKLQVLKARLSLRQNKTMSCLNLTKAILNSNERLSLPNEINGLSKVIIEAMDKLTQESLQTEAIELGKSAINYFSDPALKSLNLEINGELMCFIAKAYLKSRDPESMKQAEAIISTIDETYTTLSIIDVKIIYLKQNNRIEEIPDVFYQYIKKNKLAYIEIEKLTDAILNFGESYSFELAIRALDNILKDINIQDTNIREKLGLLKVYFLNHEERELKETLLLSQEVYDKHINSNNASEAFKFLLWEKADLFFESKEFNGAFEVYYYTLKNLYKSDAKDKDRSLTLIKMAICKLELNDYFKAKELLTEARNIDPENRYIKIYTLIIALKEDKFSHEINENDLISDFSELEPSLLVFLCQTAYQTNNASLTFRFVNASLTSFQKISSLKQEDSSMLIKLTRLCLNDILKKDIRMLDEDIYKTYSKVIDLILEFAPTYNEELQNEKNAIISQIWNIGSLKFKSRLYKSSEIFFNLIKKIIKDKELNKDQVYQISTANILSAASCLLNGNKDTKVLNEYYLSCQEAYKEQTKHADLNDKSLNEQLCLVIFQLAIKLNKWEELEDLIKKFDIILIESSRSFYERLLDTILLESECPKPVLVKCIKLLIDQLLKSNNMDIYVFSKWLHILITFSLSLNDEAGFAYLKQAMDIINVNSKEYPQDEIQWLSIVSWNHGLNKIEKTRDIKCKVWFEYSIQLSSYLDDSSTHNKMIECFDKIIKSYIIYV